MPALSCFVFRVYTLFMFTGFIGTYTKGGDGIYSFTFDPHTGAVHDLKLAYKVENPSYLILNRSKSRLFAVLESKDGAVLAFALREGGLELLNGQSSFGDDPCHIALSPDEDFLIVSNYSSATIAVLPVDRGGLLEEAVQVIKLSGSGPNKARQDCAHAHSCTFSPDGNFVFACDLGSDRVIVYGFESSSGRLTELTHYSSKAGAGPRHIVFSHDGGHAYLVNELDSSVDVLSVNGGTPYLLQSLSTLPSDFSAENTASAIKMSADGKYVYVSNRGHNSIALYAVQSDATLNFITAERSGGKSPRDFSIDPSGEFLLVCHQDSDDITVFRQALPPAPVLPAPYRDRRTTLCLQEAGCTAFFRQKAVRLTF